jgi:hypothetical protein
MLVRKPVYFFLIILVLAGLGEAADAMVELYVL